MGREGTQKKTTRRTAAKRPEPPMLPQARVAGAVATMAEPKGTARFGAGKVLCVTARKDPSRVYPHLDEIAALLDSESKVVRWNALQLMGLLARVDDERKLDSYLDAYLGIITGGNLISAANAIQGAGLIAQSRSDLVERVVRVLLSVEQATYDTDECRNVALGHVLKVLQALGPSVLSRPAVTEFIRRQEGNTRAAVARHAAKLAAGLPGGA